MRLLPWRTACRRLFRASTALQWTPPWSRAIHVLNFGGADLVPVSEPAQQIIASALELIGDDDVYLFPSPAKHAAPITSHALAVAMARFGAGLDGGAVRTWKADPPSPHDLRRTVATRL